MVSDYYTGQIPPVTKGATTSIKNLNKLTNITVQIKLLYYLNECLQTILVGPILRKGQFLTISISTYNF